ncbi:MAG: methyltransferase domain-containing protein, partial [Candidatus Omnitrophota bacterium]|nr:methyltransferase domain-containing protein [Candidatus Omnitrophota bacterium]
MDTSMTFMRKQENVKHKSRNRFNEWSKKYDKSILQLLVFQKSHDMFIREMLTDNRKLKILDIGCGTGELATQLKSRKKDAHIFGIDISPD